jgi:hypothetical protein
MYRLHSVTVVPTPLHGDYKVIYTFVDATNVLDRRPVRTKGALSKEEADALAQHVLTNTHASWRWHDVPFHIYSYYTPRVVVLALDHSRVR